MTQFDNPNCRVLLGRMLTNPGLPLVRLLNRQSSRLLTQSEEWLSKRTYRVVMSYDGYDASSQRNWSIDLAIAREPVD
jgi:hypothetical protein